MKDIFLLNYKVRGIKTLDQDISLSFYKKTITMPINTQEYNVKGIYGMNGSGKSGIIASVDILRSLLIYEDYLNNPIIQKSLDAMINKKTKELCIEVEFLIKVTKTDIRLYHYEITLKKNTDGKFVIEKEYLSYKTATSRKQNFTPMIEVKDGVIVRIYSDAEDKFANCFKDNTINLLSNSTVSALFAWRIVGTKYRTKIVKNLLSDSLAALFLFGDIISVYMDQSDYHKDYLISDMLKYYPKLSEKNSDFTRFLDNSIQMSSSPLGMFSTGTNSIPKIEYENFENSVKKLQGFIQLFKPDLLGIDIDKKVNGDNYACNLNMIYESYSVNVEFESTGIKKLIQLYIYFMKMVQGGIVFIDELDSNLHDVYLCALLEYLMDHGKGQLCFTTHNLGPMDILKRHKKSIDFLSLDSKIYPWTTNGNYSPSNLYRSGMIEGSPFNIDSIDFIGVFD